MKFYGWLKLQTHRQDDVGLFARNFTPAVGMGNAGYDGWHRTALLKSYLLPNFLEDVFEKVWKEYEESPESKDCVSDDPPAMEENRGKEELPYRYIVLPE